jgi:sigma-B regulation protein RsbU (phosphoserine phosphatase)
MKEIFDVAPCGYFSFFDDGELHVVNETLCHLLGYEKNELEGRNVETIFTIPTRIFYQTHFFPLVKMHGHAEEIFITLHTREKEHLPVLLNAKRENGNSKPYTACAFIVVVNRKKFEDELIAARNTAETALKENSELVKAKMDLQEHAKQLDDNIHLVKKQNHELKQINHVVTHNLSEPVRKLLLYSQKLKDGSLPANLQNDVEKLSKASEQMRHVVSGLQQYVWLNDAIAEFNNTNLNDLLKKVQGQVEKDLGITLTVKSDQLPVIKGDNKQLELLFYHILANAAKFRKHQFPEVIISSSIIQQNTFKAMENKYKYEDFLKLQFKDQGLGFDPGFEEEAFELFKKFHLLPGLGLGLALCKKIVDNHLGYISADSKINEGTIITVVLPLNYSD